MTSVTEFLPIPRHLEEDVVEEEEEDGVDVGAQDRHKVAAPAVKVPSYPNRNRCRPRFIPHRPEDYGDGGAYPEIRITQFPLEMGRKGQGTGVSKTVAMRVDEDGNADYATVVKQGEKSSAVVHASYKDLMEKPRNEQRLQKPSEEVERETAERTRKALDQLVSGKTAAAKPRNFRGSGGTPKPTFIKYSAAGGDPRHNSGASERIIRMMEAPIDPLEPPKFHQKKVPPAPPSPPAPVMHSPPRKLSAEDAKNWKIPPCISNWKNNKGFTIPLDKRLAADGRGLQDLRINDNFAKLAESMYTAERTARDMVEQRAKMQRHITLKEKDRKEQELRELAARARAERSGVLRPGATANASVAPSVTEEEPSRGRDSPQPERENSPPPRREATSPQRRLVERVDGAAARKRKLHRERERDVSEKLALGQKVSSNPNDEVMYDQRLFNQGKSGMDSGFAAEDTYNLYDKPLFAGKGDGFMYRPGGDEGINTARFKADQGFAGTQDTHASRGAARSKPVEFEKEAGSSTKEQAGQGEDDPFGFGKFLSDAKKARSDKMDKTLERRKKGSMGL